MTVVKDYENIIVKKQQKNVQKCTEDIRWLCKSWVLYKLASISRDNLTLLTASQRPVCQQCFRWVPWLYISKSVHNVFTYSVSANFPHMVKKWAFIIFVIFSAESNIISTSHTNQLHCVHEKSNPMYTLS